MLGALILLFENVTLDNLPELLQQGPGPWLIPGPGNLNWAEPPRLLLPDRPILVCVTPCHAQTCHWAHRAEGLGLACSPSTLTPQVQIRLWESIMLIKLRADGPSTWHWPGPQSLVQVERRGVGKRPLCHWTSPSPSHSSRLRLSVSVLSLALTPT